MSAPTPRDALLPGNATPFETAQSQTAARLLDTDVNIIRRERRPDLCDAPFLPLLGWERSVHHWSGVAAIDAARVAASFGDHLSYGTPSALEKELTLDTGVAITVLDFFEAGLPWPQFFVGVNVYDDAPIVSAKTVLASTLRRKNVRDDPVVSYLARESGQLYLGAYLECQITIGLMPAPTNEGLDAPLAFGAALSAIVNYNLEPF